MKLTTFKQEHIRAKSLDKKQLYLVFKYLYPKLKLKLGMIVLILQMLTIAKHYNIVFSGLHVATSPLTEREQARECFREANITGQEI